MTISSSRLGVLCAVMFFAGFMVAVAINLLV